MIKYNDYREAFKHIPNELQEFIVKMNGLSSNSSAFESRENFVNMLGHAKDNINRILDETIERAKEISLVDGNCIVRVEHGYNGIVSGRLYHATIDKNSVTFIRGNNSLNTIPQKLGFDDVTIIKNPTEEDVEAADKNSEVAYNLYYAHSIVKKNKLKLT